MNNEETSETLQGSNKNNIGASSVPSKSETTIAASISSVTRDTGMMAIHQTHSASAHKISGSPNTIDSTQATRNLCPSGRTDTEFHHQGGSQRTTHHHVSNQIRTFRAMPSISAAEQLSATTHPSQETPREQEAETSTIQSSTSNNSRRDQQEQMCLGTSNVKPSEAMTGGSSVGGSTSSRTGGRSDFDDQSQSSKASSSSKRKRPIKMKAGQTLGRWTPEEHEAFLQGLKVFGREWKKVAERIPTRTSAQIRSHAQKYFAKIEREETIMMQDAAVAATQLASQPFNNTVPEAVAPPPQVPPTVQRNVERILANPTGLQREVEDTMRELRERYHQLQVRLAETSRRRHGAAPLRCRVVQNDPDRRKRPLEEVMHHNDDLSSVSSTISAYTRELGDEELIALSVLGGALPRSASNQDLRRAASNDDKSQLSARSENSSPTSTVASHRQNSQAGESDEDKNKKRKVTDEEPSNNSNFDDESTNTRDDMVL